MPRPSRLLLLLSLSTLTACAGAKWTTTTTVGDKTTVRGDEESMKQHQAQEEAAKQREAAIAAAPRRAPSDPIEVVLLQATVSEDLKASLDAARANAALLDALKADPLLRVKVVRGLEKRSGGAPHTLADAVRAAQEQGQSGDVYVFPHILLEDAVGQSASGKLAAAKAFTVSAEVASHWDGRTVAPRARGSLFQNQKVLGDAGAAIRRAVVQDLGPGLPQRAAVAKYDEEQRAAQVKALQDQAGIKPEDDSATRLRKLFQPRSQQPRPEEGTAASPKP
jgi:hypothetical protein